MRPLRWVFASVCLVSATAACNNDATGSNTTSASVNPVATTVPATTTPGTTTAGTAAVATTVAATTVPTSAPVTNPSATTAPVATVPHDEFTAAAVQAWVDGWNAAATDNATVAGLASLAAPDVANAMIEITHVTGVTATVVPVPSATLNPDGTVTIEECILIEPTIHAYPSLHYTGVVTPQADGTWQTTAIAPHSPGCVPAAINDEVIARYNDYLVLRSEFGNPPNPDDPRFPEIFLDPTPFTSRLTEMLAVGESYQLNIESHPEVVRYTVDESSVVDCSLVTGPTGFFDSQNAPIGDNAVEGETVYGDATFVRSGDRWLVKGAVVQPRQCEVAGVNAELFVLGQ